jgi:hypothetical protein
MTSTADRGHRRAEATYLVEVGEISTNQRAETSSDIGKRRRLVARQYHCNDGGHQDGHEDRHRDTKAGNRMGHPMDRQGDDCCRQQTFHP